METESISAEKIKIGVVDDHAMFREGIVALLRDYPSLDVVLQAESGADLVKQLDLMRVTHPERLPDLVLLDFQMPDMDGSQTTLFLQKMYPEIRIVILTMHNEEQLIYDLMNKGASGFLAKDKTVDAVVDVILSVARNGIYVDDHILQSIVNTWQKGQNANKIKAELQLSDREHEIIQLLADQKTTREIAAALHISTRTVDIHRKSIFVKTNTRNTAGLILFAIRNNLLRIR